MGKGRFYHSASRISREGFGLRNDEIFRIRGRLRYLVGDLGLVGGVAAVSIEGRGENLVTVLMAGLSGAVQIAELALLLKAILVGDRNLRQLAKCIGVLRAVDLEAAEVAQPA